MYISYGIGCETANHQDQWVKIYVEKNSMEKRSIPCVFNMTQHWFIKQKLLGDALFTPVWC